MSRSSRQILNLYLLKLIYLYQKKKFQIYRNFDEENERLERNDESKKKKVMILKKIKSFQQKKVKKPKNNNNISNGVNRNHNHSHAKKENVPKVKKENSVKVKKEKINKNQNTTKEIKDIDYIKQLKLKIEKNNPVVNDEFVEKVIQREKDIKKIEQDIQDKLKQKNLTKEERHKEKKRLRQLHHKIQKQRKQGEKRDRIKVENHEEHRKTSELEYKLRKCRQKILQVGFDKKFEAEFQKEFEEIQRLKNTNQYRNRHFHWKDNFLYAYTPKDYISRNKCFLYCWKTGCKAKIRIDMVEKTCEEFGEHIPHKSFDTEKPSKEYPGLLDKDWTHIQYDIIGDKRILVWKV